MALQAISAVCLVDLVADEVASRHNDLLTKARARNMSDVLRNARLAVHQRLQIVCAEH